jgi:hypothetical protein
VASFSSGELLLKSLYDPFITSRIVQHTTLLLLFRIQKVDSGFAYARLHTKRTYTWKRQSGTSDDRSWVRAVYIASRT